MRHGSLRRTTYVDSQSTRPRAVQEELNYMYLSADTREKLGMALDVYGDVVNIMHSVSCHDSCVV
jgi:hypothetical protein